MYSDTGFFTVRLIVLNNGCADTLELIDYIHINPPIAIFSSSFLCSEPFKKTFIDASIGADSWNWDFGDGTTSTLQNPVHIYSLPGIYTVTLTVFNIRTGCDFTTTLQVQIFDANADFAASDTIICRNTNVDFTATGSLAGIGIFNWDFGDDSTGTGINVSHVYKNSGNYTVKLYTTDLAGCTDTLIKIQYIRVNGPVASFTPANTGSCLLNAVSFNDQSSNDGLHPISSWIWTFGDGQTDTLFAPPFQHFYNNPGIYSVSLTVTDSEGCSDVITKNNLLTISRPVAAFNSADTATCPGKNVRFINVSTGPALSYTWNFGDGTSSTQAQPTHIYSANGTYSVKLIITDQFGCSDSLLKPSYVRVVTPVAAFTVSDSISTCPPLVVQFTNTSQNSTSMQWNFGDGSTSNIPNPSHFYNIPGTYIARLSIVGPGGCISIKQKTIVVRGPYGSFTYGLLTGCRPMSVNFTAITRSRNSFIWDFNDGSTQATTDSTVSHTYTIPGTYIPKMILVDAGGCLVAITGTDTIVVNGVNASFTTNTNLFCDRGDVLFTNTSTSNQLITGYQWNFGDGTSSTAPNPLHTYNRTGIFYPILKAITVSGCRDSIRSAIPIKVVKKPDVQVTRSPDGCVPLSVIFSSNLINPDTSAIRYFWTFGNGQVSSIANPLPQQFNTAGNYNTQLIVINSSGCADTSKPIVRAFPLPVIKTGIDSFICKGRGITITATGGANYTWSPPAGLSCINCPNPVANPDSAREYHVTGTSLLGCSSKDSIKIKVIYPFKITNSPPDSLCLGASAKLFATGADSYSWTASGGVNISNVSLITVSPRQTTTYRVIGKDNKNCFADTAFIPITVFPIPTVEAGEDKTINVGQSVDLVPVISPDVIRATWTPTGNVTRTTFPSINVKPKETTQYRVEVSNKGGCKTSDVVTVFVLCNGANVFIPNTFSPNGDGANEIFYPRGSGLFSIKSMKIFNRWGEMLYEKNDFMPNDERAGWNGTYKGIKSNSDVFIYIMEILCDNNTILTYKGNVALVK